MGDSIILYGCWVFQGLAIYLWVRWAELERKHSDEGDWVYNLA